MLSKAEKHAFKIVIIDIRDRASFFVRENQHCIKMNWTTGQRGWVKVISAAEKNEKKPRRPSPHEYRKCRETSNHIRLPATKRRVRNRDPLKRAVYRIEGTSCIFAEKFPFLRQRKTCSWKLYSNREEEIVIVPFEKKNISHVLYLCEVISVSH